MIELVGDLWQEHARGAIIVITTHGLLSQDGKIVMLRGCARQASGRFPEIPAILGDLVLNHGNHVFDLGRRIASFPVEIDPYQTPLLSLIERSCQELVELADYKNWRRVVVPRPGCGGGGLAWSEVRPILQRYLDDRFYLISRKET